MPPVSYPWCVGNLCSISTNGDLSGAMGPFAFDTNPSSMPRMMTRSESIALYSPQDLAQMK